MYAYIVANGELSKTDLLEISRYSSISDMKGNTLTVSGRRLTWKHVLMYCWAQIY